MSKVDPTELNKLDRRSTLLLQAARRNAEITEKSVSGAEEPGLDALRGSFGTIGSIIRARSVNRMSSASNRPPASSLRSRYGDPERALGLPSMQRHQLWDAPMPGSPPQQPGIPLAPQKQTTVKFGQEDVAHYYHSPGQPGESRHERQQAHGLPPSSSAETGPMTAPPGGRSRFIATDPFQDGPKTTGMSPSDASYPSSTSTLGGDDGESPKARRGFVPFSSRSYPHGRRDDDREESISLVGDGVDLDNEGVRGIRLVDNKSRRL